MLRRRNRTAEWILRSPTYRALARVSVMPRHRFPPFLFGRREKEGDGKEVPLVCSSIDETERMGP